MINHQSQIANLKSQIAQLQAEKEQLRLLLHELLEAFYKSLNGNQKEPSTTWTFNPDLEQLFKNLANCKTNCSHQPTSGATSNGNNFRPNECHWNQIKNFFAKMKSETQENHD